MFTLLCLALCTSQLSNTNSCRQSGWTQLNAGKTDWHSHINPCHAGFCLRKPPSTWPIILSGAYKPHTTTFNGWQMSGHASCIDHKHYINADKKASEISRALDREGQIHFICFSLSPSTPSYSLTLPSNSSHPGKRQLFNNDANTSRKRTAAWPIPVI